MEEKDRTYEIMLLICSQYDLEEPGLVVPVVSMLSNFIPSPEIVFSTACDILNRQDWFVSPNAARHRMRLFSFRQLVANFLPKEAVALESMGALDEPYLNLIFLDLFVPLVPSIYCAKIFDMFLLEGNKILHRFGIALISACKHKLETESISTAQEFWNNVKHFCNSGLDWSRLVNAAFAIGSSTLSKLSNSSTSLTRAALLRYEVMAKTALGDALHKPLNLNYKRNAKETASGNALSANAIEGASRLIDNGCGVRLRMFLPEVMNMEGFSLVFSTHKDGWSLGTLYAKTEGLYPCLIIIRTLTHDAVVGVYITSAISPPSGAVRGDGNSFVCRLDGPEAACYRWVGSNDLGGRSVSVDGHITGDFTRSQFGLFLDSCIMIGGSEIKGENAVYLNADLSTCLFGTSDTFGNGQLAPHDPSGAAMVADIEVLCGTRSVKQAKASGALDVKRRNWSVDAESERDSYGRRRHGNSESKAPTILAKKSGSPAPASNPILGLGDVSQQRTRSFSGTDYTALAGNEV